MSEAETRHIGQSRGGNVRTAQIGIVYIISAASASAIQFGDRGETNAKLQALAVQRSESHATAGNVYFESYPMFTNPYPVPQDPELYSGADIAISRSNVCPTISVGCIRVIAAGSASSIQAGNNMRVIADSRIKHTRQFPRQPSWRPSGSPISSEQTFQTVMPSDDA